MQANNMINIVSDESNNHTGDRILNMTVLTKDHESFHAFSESASAMKLDAEATATWMLKKIDQLTRSNFKKVNSVATDTCSLERAVWDILGSDTRLQHAFFIPCDSHGLQLLIKDLLGLESLSVVFLQALKVVNSLRKAKHHLGILRKHQQAIYGEKRALIVSTILRWGTQVDLLESVSRNKQALQRFALDEDVVFQVKKDKPLNPIKTWLVDSNFWASLDDLINILRPIYEAQNLSERNGATIDLVYSRCLNIQKHLTQQAKYTRFAHNLNKFLALRFRQRLNKQISLAHRVAHYLHPENYNKPLDIFKQGEILAFMKCHTTRNQHAQIENKFYDYRERQNNFSLVKGAWENAGDPILFWRKMVRYMALF